MARRGGGAGLQVQRQGPEPPRVVPAHLAHIGGQQSRRAAGQNQGAGLPRAQRRDRAGAGGVPRRAQSRRALSQTIHDNITRKHHTVLLSIDATAAFDRTVKSKLYETVERKGLPKEIIAWFTAFLTDRKARVRGRARDEPLPNVQGVVPAGHGAWPALLDHLHR